MQIFNGSAVVLKDGRDVCGFSFSSMQELMEKTSTLTPGEIEKVTVQIHQAGQQKAERYRGSLSEIKTRDLVLELLNRKEVNMPVSYPVTVLFIHEVDPLGERTCGTCGLAAVETGPPDQ